MKKQAGNRGQGRPKGALNIINADVKAMLLGSLEDVGGREYFARQAEENPNAYMALIGKILPKETEVKSVENNEPKRIIIVNAEDEFKNE